APARSITGTPHTAIEIGIKRCPIVRTTPGVHCSVNVAATARRDSIQTTARSAAKGGDDVDFWKKPTQEARSGPGSPAAIETAPRPGGRADHRRRNVRTAPVGLLGFDRRTHLCGDGEEAGVTSAARALAVVVAFAGAG